jgi:hypothetical protein
MLSFVIKTVEEFARPPVEWSLIEKVDFYWREVKGESDAAPQGLKAKVQAIYKELV